MLDISTTARVILAAVAAAQALPRTGRAEDVQQPALSAEQLEFFEKQIRPVLVERCFKCHGGKKHEGHLHLDSRAGMLKGGNTGPAVAPGKLDEGELLLAISYDPDGYQMPPDGKLPDEQIAAFRKWVEMGAPWPAEETAGNDAAPDRIPGKIDAEEFTRRAKHWSFQPLKHPHIPKVSNPEWCRTPIDRFLLSKLDEAGLRPAEETDQRTWLRRVYFDVIGLPPTPQEIHAFLADDQPGAEERVIERLLGDPHFGERWGRHWLDLVRYAESRGHEFDYDVANPWHYRDYVIRAINGDLPYDRFVVEHVAGDLLREKCPHATYDAPAPTPLVNYRYHYRLDPLTGANESIVGTGWWYMGEWVHSPVDIRQDEADRFENMLDVYSKTFLGLTVACARCHDHKFDPITQKDFYALQGYLQSSGYRQARFETMEHNRGIAKELEKVYESSRLPLMRTLNELISPVAEGLPKYLTAAKVIIRGHPDINQFLEHAKTGSAGFDDKISKEIDTIGRREHLDPALLTNWVSHLLAASQNVQDPYYLWAQYCTGQLPTIQSVVNRAKELQIELSDEFPAPELPFQDQRPWIRNTDGVRFSAPRDVVDFRLWLSDDPEQPISFVSGNTREVLTNPDFSILQVSRDSTPEPGGLSDAGPGMQSVCTTSFEIGADRLFCLIRGGCTTYVVVDSHTLIKGPLHGSLLQKHDSNPEWHWIEHDVSRYRGHGAHLQFLLPSGGSFAVDRIVQADRLQTKSPLRPSTCSELNASVVVIDSQYGSQPFDESKLVSIFSVGGPNLPWHESIVNKSGISVAALDALNNEDEVDWIIQHPELFGLDRTHAREAWATASESFVNSRKNLVQQIRPTSATCPAMMDLSEEDEYVFLRGNWKKRGETVPRRFLEVFHGVGPATQGTSEDQKDPGSGRYELALQMVDPQQTPILPRVIVNRIWQHYFGRGIVATPDDFGHLGQAPSHPELLDWLANELVEHDWSLKHIHRLILSSAAYRMASEESRDERPESRAVDVRVSSTAQRPNASTIDPNNVLLHRMNVKRLEGEIIRDAVLTVSGRLDERMYGPSTPVHLTPFMEGRGRPSVSGPVDGEGRRSIYIAVRRNFPDPFFQAFDFPNPHSTIGRRTVSNVPAQALALMNNPLITEQSALWATQTLALQNEAAAVSRTLQVSGTLDALYESAYGRLPTGQERASAETFLNQQAESYGSSPDDERVWADLCHVLINVKEFLFVR